MALHLPESLRDLRLFIAVYEERSFTAAAQRENFTQSGVSHHIRKIEDMLGSQLFVRRTSSVVPTPAGDAFYAGCTNILRLLDDTRRKLVSFEKGLEGGARIGVTPTIARCVLAPALSRFVAKCPNVLIHVTEAYSSLVTDRLRAGELDVAIVPAMPHELGITGQLITRTPEYLVASTATARNLGLQGDFDRNVELKLVMPSRAQARRAELDGYIATNGLRLGGVLEMDSIFGTFDFVANTDWTAILPAIMLARNLDSRFIAFPLRPPLLLDLYRIENPSRQLSTAASTLISFFEEEARAQQETIEREWGKATSSKARKRSSRDRT